MLKPSVIDPIVKAALREDIGARDVTSSAALPRSLITKAAIQVNEKAVLCGLEIAERVFRLVDEDLRFLPVAKDGESVERGREIAYIEGSAQSLLMAERTALNFLSHLSGIATQTRAFVDKVRSTKVKIMDTRKTTPGLRALEKYAVLTGGGANHRFGLYDQALIKDNHLRVLRKRPLGEIVTQVKRSVLKKTLVGVEVKNLAELKEALQSAADYILLDNMTPEMVREAVNLKKRLGKGPAFEVSGGVDLDNVLDYASIGVERISIGALTHTFRAINLSLDIVG
ncbi:MAG: carboxylating nicotinate-nucleotide diphosphorylase [Candidatus Omnitrophica bacterium]|nr:carboxylating nicotinate-nucleotide diphosphorylase [Candidatus Omnitrophota bacterium]